jgi:DNA-directed RNA polymerase specialized sigma24 family protein
MEQTARPTRPPDPSGWLEVTPPQRAKLIAIAATAMSDAPHDDAFAVLGESAEDVVQQTLLEFFERRTLTRARNREALATTAMHNRGIDRRRRARFDQPLPADIHPTQTQVGSLIRYHNTGRTTPRRQTTQ